MTFIAQIETAIKAVDHASNQSLQWLLIASLFIIGTFAWGVIRWLVRWASAQSAKMEERARRDETAVEHRIIMIHENTEMLREVKELLAQVKNLMVNGPKQ